MPNFHFYTKSLQAMAIISELVLCACEMPAVLGRFVVLRLPNVGNVQARADTSHSKIL